MSLDVYLTTPGSSRSQEMGSGIFVREHGTTKEISREEWDARHPGRAPVVVKPSQEMTEEVFTANITHNLNTMASEAGIYQELWQPDEIGITQAEQLIAPLQRGLALLQSDPDRFRALNPRNGWGQYEGLVSFVSRYLTACQTYPDAAVHVSR